MLKRSADAHESTGKLGMRVKKRLGNFRLEIEFHVPLGLIVLFGASGAGKSLTLGSLAGLLRPQEGRIMIDGHLLYDSATGLDLPPQQRSIGYVPQHYALFPHLTVAENVRFGLPARSRRNSARGQARVVELLTALELQGLEKRYPATLSGGQQQRVALARALAAEPRLLLLDEPFNALDAPVRERLREALKAFQRRFAVPIVLVTHDHEEAQQLADTIVVLQQGRVVQVGTVQEIFLAPRGAAVARLVGQRNFFEGYIAPPPGVESASTPDQALRLCWLSHSGDVQARSDRVEKGQQAAWLPLPLASPGSNPRGERKMAGSILADEVLVHPWPESAVTPTLWSPRGAALWRATLLEARFSGNNVLLLVRPQWGEEQAAHVFTPTAQQEGVLEVYLSRRRWRACEVKPGQTLLLEIGPEALHPFEADA